MGKEAFRKGQGFCAFCQSPGLTREHIWADWLRRYIERTLESHTESVTVANRDGETETLFRRTGDPHSRRIRCVCAACNNGWMSRLQVAVKPFLVPTLEGRRISFHRRAQGVLAAWCAMTAMVVEQLYRQQAAIPQSHRDHLRLHHSAPSHWRIWLSRHEREKHKLISHRAMSFGTKEDFERIGVPFENWASNTQTTTVCLGKHLLIHIMSSDIAWHNVRKYRFPVPVAPYLYQIWPIRERIVSWPPPGAFNDDGIALIADHFYETALRVIRAGNAPPT
jgi:hypothetical protein